MWAKYCPLSHSQPVSLHWHSLKKNPKPPNLALICLWLVRILKKLLHLRYQCLMTYCHSNYTSFLLHQRKAQGRRSPRNRPQTLQKVRLKEMQRQGIKLPGIASSSSSPLVRDRGSGKGWICSGFFMAVDNLIGRPLERKYSVLTFVSTILETVEEKNCQNIGVSAELRVWSTRAVKQVNAAGPCCRRVRAQFAGRRLQEVCAYSGLAYGFCTFTFCSRLVCN